MSEQFFSDAERQRTAVANLEQYLMAEFPRMFDDQIEEHFRSIRSAISTARLPDVQAPDDVEVMGSDPLARNYLVGQCSILLLFANRVSQLERTGRVAELPQALSTMWEELGRLHLMFFGERYL